MVLSCASRDRDRKLELDICADPKLLNIATTARDRECAMWWGPTVILDVPRANRLAEALRLFIQAARKSEATDD